VPLILQLIKDLAEYEKEPDAVKTTEEDLLRDGFPPDGSPPFFHVLIATVEAQDKPQIAGFALFFFQYSTWEGRVLYLEDIFVRPAFRRLGAGLALFQSLAQIAQHFNCKRYCPSSLLWYGLFLMSLCADFNGKS